MKWMPGQIFMHGFWVKDLKSREPVECEIVEVTDKKITYRPTDRSDRRFGRCRPNEFKRQVDMSNWRTAGADG